MTKLTVFFKQFRLRQILTVLLATVVLFVNTACNSGTVQGARPDNPPVQAGGANNPYKNGGDSYTNYRMSPDPKVSSEPGNFKRNRADLPLSINQLIAASGGNLYPGAEQPANQPAIEKSLPRIGLQDFEQPEAGGQNQRKSDVGERVESRLNTVKDAFGKASEFIGEGANEGARAGLQASEQRPDTPARR
ncbi:MAG TPA: DUF6658 family protein [Coleofasciculaceae cyanobacterium]